MSSPNTCVATFNKYKPEGYEVEGSTMEYGEKVCHIDYLNKSMVDDLESTVDCEQKCDDGDYSDDEEEQAAIEAEHDECVKDCHEMIKAYSKGVFRVRETGEVVEANIPLTISPFLTEGGAFAETGLYEGWDQRVAERFDELGCRADPDVGFRHPHEFAATTAGTEPDEDPAAFALHIRGGERGACMLSDVLNLLRAMQGQKPAGASRFDYMFENLLSDTMEADV